MTWATSRLSMMFLYLRVCFKSRRKALQANYNKKVNAPDKLPDKPLNEKLTQVEATKPPSQPASPEKPTAHELTLARMQPVPRSPSSGSD